MAKKCEIKFLYILSLLDQENAVYLYIPIGKCNYYNHGTVARVIKYPVKTTYQMCLIKRK